MGWLNLVSRWWWKRRLSNPRTGPARLARAVVENDGPWLRRCLDAGVSPHRSADSPPSWPASCPSLGVWLVEKDAAQLIEQAGCLPDGLAAMEKSCRTDRADCLAALWATTPQASGSQSRLLALSLASNAVNCVAFLASSSPSLPCPPGKKPWLHQARGSAALKVLLEAGAPLDAKDEEGHAAPGFWLGYPPLGLEVLEMIEVVKKKASTVLEESLPALLAALPAWESAGRAENARAVAGRLIELGAPVSAQALHQALGEGHPPYLPSPALFGLLLDQAGIAAIEACDEQGYPVEMRLESSPNAPQRDVLLALCQGVRMEQVLRCSSRFG